MFYVGVVISAHIFSPEDAFSSRRLNLHLFASPGREPDNGYVYTFTCYRVTYPSDMDQHLSYPLQRHSPVRLGPLRLFAARWRPEWSAHTHIVADQGLARALFHPLQWGRAETENASLDVD
jgi:hypothetical protein